VQLRQERIMLREVLLEALESTCSPIESKRLELTVAIPEEPIFVRGDRDRLTQIFSNLMSNAAKYTPAGGKVALSLQHIDGDAIVSVRDTGVGIPGEALERVFEMFSQLTPSEHGEGGLGIGLALVRQLVHMHGGSVRAFSAGPGHGSEFIVRLPALDGTGTVERLPPRSSDAAGAWGQLRVLVVDDNRDAAESLGALLQLLGHEVHLATDGLAAVAAVQELMPDVVFMDIGMPGLSGLEAARRIRALPLERQPRIFALTGWGQDADRERSQQAGIDRHLVKPIELTTLKAVLEEHADERSVPS